MGFLVKCDGRLYSAIDGMINQLPHPSTVAELAPRLAGAVVWVLNEANCSPTPSSLGSGHRVGSAVDAALVLSLL